ncbi:MAG: hypothetical protein A2846_03440 [Candidatus Doudnabacteria bacterium RIFCSPHIGHO2_01_FULL_49_9]|uniref:DNA methylase N-4/N-6 domain-containing protein n=1 Tax=Candidatus Doudnabacteria bacterium RIFCSPHIGHO2_01_FULL_49_9 TaxID=1817827 RepID=A0A1F5NZY0_9BACT|nr:MAG: hypothetical protein A2846_03440 [Candidatus Doudnabacteria bacterium RIFCSPHIGHO2_01_FULL_49_9]
MKFKYAFNLGRVFTLSLAELFAVFENMGLSFRLVDLFREVLIIETEDALDALKLQKNVGGTIKIMQVLDSLGRKKNLTPSLVFKDYFDANLLKEQYLTGYHGKIQVGISYYAMAPELPIRGDNKRIGFNIKALLTAAGYSIRLVLPQNAGLSLPSVVVTGERLLEKGAEIDFLVATERVYVAKTLTVQDFEDYGRRDYQRPARDMQVGMLPPKVAQEMINLAQVPKSAIGNAKTAILDPFAGSGTVIQEAMIMGHKGIGSDISEKAIENSEKNLEWIKNRYKLPPGRFELFVSDVKHLPKVMPKVEISAVVTEATLGPAVTVAPKQNQIDANFKMLEKTYLDAFSALKNIVPPGKRIVVALPAYRVGTGYSFFPGIDKLTKLGYDILNPLPEVVLEKFTFLQVTPRKSIIYDRKDQFVSREIFIFKVT